MFLYLLNKIPHCANMMLLSRFFTVALHSVCVYTEKHFSATVLFGSMQVFWRWGLPFRSLSASLSLVKSFPTLCAPRLRASPHPGGKNRISHMSWLAAGTVCICVLVCLCLASVRRQVTWASWSLPLCKCFTCKTSKPQTNLWERTPKGGNCTCLCCVCFTLNP